MSNDRKPMTEMSDQEIEANLKFQAGNIERLKDTTDPTGKMQLACCRAIFAALKCTQIARAIVPNRRKSDRPAPAPTDNKVVYLAEWKAKREVKFDC